MGLQFNFYDNCLEYGYIPNVLHTILMRPKVHFSMVWVLK